MPIKSDNSFLALAARYALLLGLVVRFAAFLAVRWVVPANSPPDNPDTFALTLVMRFTRDFLPPLAPCLQFCLITRLHVYAIHGRIAYIMPSHCSVR